MLYWVISAIYVLVCAFLVLVVLLQQGKGGMGSAFGGSSQTVFGGAGAGNVLTRATTASATLFMVLSAVLAYMSSSSDAALEERARQHEVEQTNRRELREAAESATVEGALQDVEEGLVEPQPLQLELGGDTTSLELEAIGADGTTEEIEVTLPGGDEPAPAEAPAPSAAPSPAPARAPAPSAAPAPAEEAPAEAPAAAAEPTEE